MLTALFDSRKVIRFIKRFKNIFTKYMLLRKYLNLTLKMVFDHKKNLKDLFDLQNINT
jgi:hypothetical protein